MKQVQRLTQEQYQRCLLGYENNESAESIAKATGVKKVTVKTYAQPKLREWLKKRASAAPVIRQRTEQKPTVTGRFRSAALNEIYDRLTPVQKDRFERAILDVVLSKAFLP
jgi:hypothetical protein